MAHKSKYTPIRVREDHYAKLKAMAEAEDRSIQKMLNRILTEVFNKAEEKK